MNMSALDESVLNATQDGSFRNGSKKKGKKEIADEELLKSDSESYKAIFALVKLFMSKSAHSSLSSREDQDDDPVA